MKTKKGFTLMELVIVIAIIGILLAVLIPSWNYFILRAEVRKQNSNARVVYNAAQTEATKAKFRERAARTDGKTDQLYVGGNSGTFCYYWDGKNGYACDLTSGAKLEPAQDAYNYQFAKSIGKVFENQDDVEYKIYIKDYKVISVCCAGLGSGRVGTYPKEQDKGNDDDVKTYDMSSIAFS